MFEFGNERLPIVETFMTIILVILLAFVSALLLRPIVYKIVTSNKKLLVKNFKEMEIPSAFGLLFIFNYLLFGLIIIGLMKMFGPLKSFGPFHYLDLRAPHNRVIWIYTYLALPGLVGLYDDIMAKSEVKGLMNNFKYSIKHMTLTPSLIKALFLFILALIVSFFKHSHSFSFSYFRLLSMEPFRIFQIFGDAIMICLFANFFNLLDLRPGRAIKVFLFMLTICFVPLFVELYRHPYYAIFTQENLILVDLTWSFLVVAPLLGAMLAYAPLDFKGKAMMGDTGSNMLGFLIGTNIVFALEKGFAIVVIGGIFVDRSYLKMFIFSFLVLFHVYCEFYSFSDLVERNRVLRWLDRMGVSAYKEGDRQ